MYHYPSPLHMVQVQMDVSDDEGSCVRSGDLTGDVKPMQPQHLSRAFSILSSNSITAPSASSRSRSMKQKRRTKMVPRKVTKVSEGKLEEGQEDRGTDHEDEEISRHEILPQSSPVREDPAIREEDEVGFSPRSSSMDGHMKVMNPAAADATLYHTNVGNKALAFHSQTALPAGLEGGHIWNQCGNHQLTGNLREGTTQVQQHNPMLPYMGQMTLDNVKPRRGRKPKKADICHLITKNYSADGMALVKRNLTDEEMSDHSPALNQTKAIKPRGPVPSLRRIFPLEVSSSPQSEQDAEDPPDATGNEELDVDDPRRYQLIFPEIMSAEGPVHAELASSVERDESLPQRAIITSEAENVSQQDSSLLLQALKKPTPFDRRKRAARNAPAPVQVASLMRQQASKGATSHKKQAEVSICKFKFTAGPCPTLEKKKMLSVDAGGKFHFYTVGTGAGTHQQAAGNNSNRRLGNIDHGITSQDAFGQGPRPNEVANVHDIVTMNVPAELQTHDVDRMPQDTKEQDAGAAAAAATSSTDASGRRIETRSRTGTAQKTNYSSQQNQRFVRRPTDQAQPAANAPTRRRTGLRRKMEETFKHKGFLIQTQKYDAPQGATFCKFRQLKKFTRYLFRNWKDHLPAEAAGDQGSS